MKFCLFLFLIFFQIEFALSHSFDGYRCEGPDKTIAAHNGVWKEYYCVEGEWMLKINQDLPFTVKFEPVKSTVRHEYYKIIPTMPLSATQRWILRQYLLRVDSDDVMEFVKKR